MKEELIKLYKQYCDYFQETEETLYDNGGFWSKEKSFEGFIYWLENGKLN